jgi:hypothetical protein
MKTIIGPVIFAARKVCYCVAKKGCYCCDG